MQVTGVVQRIHQRGNATNILVDDVWYGCGFNGVPCKEGDQVSFTYTQRGNFKNVNVAQMVIVGRGSGNSSGQTNQNQGGGQGYQGGSGSAQRGGYQRSQGGGAAVSKDDYWKRREEKDSVTQKTIQFQAARNSAIHATEALLAANVLDLGKGKGKQHPVDVALDFIDTLTSRYYNDVVKLSEGEDPFDAPVSTEEYQQSSDDYFEDDIPF